MIYIEECAKAYNDGRDARDEHRKLREFLESTERYEASKLCEFIDKKHVEWKEEGKDLDHMKDEQILLLFR